MQAPPPGCLLRLLSTSATFSPVKASPQAVEWRALSPDATAASPRQSRAACVTVQAPFTSVRCDITITPLQFACSGKAPVLRDVYLSMSVALGNKKNVNVFYAARLRRTLSNDVPEQLFFRFLSFPKLITIRVMRIFRTRSVCHQSLRQCSRREGVCRRHICS